MSISTPRLAHHVRRIGRAAHGDKVCALIADGEIVDDFEQRRETAGGGADSDEQAWAGVLMEGGGVQTLGQRTNWVLAQVPGAGRICRGRLALM